MRPTEPTEEEILLALSRRPAVSLSADGFQPAAVLLPIFLKDGRWQVLLTRRTEQVEKHKGEISFPGGHIDAEDTDALSAALRETEEEVGIPRDNVKVLGRLDDLLTMTGFCIHPFVGRIHYPFSVRPAAVEIAEIILLPLQDFLDPAVFRRMEFTRNGAAYPVYSFLVRGYNVWGATARILKQFLEVCLGYEEPETCG